MDEDQNGSPAWHIVYYICIFIIHIIVYVYHACIYTYTSYTLFYIYIHYMRWKIGMLMCTAHNMSDMKVI